MEDDTVEERRIRGRWWSPECPARSAVPGTLVIGSDRSSHLELDAPPKAMPFERDPFDLPAGPVVSPFRMIGQGRHGEKYTLDRCFMRSGTLFRAHNVFLGRWFRKGTPTLREVQFGLSRLSDWTGQNIFEGYPHRHREEDGELVGSASWRFPPPIDATLPDGTRVTVRVWAADSYKQSSITVDQVAYASIQFPRLTDFDAIQRSIGIFRNFATVGMGETAHLEWLRGYAKPVHGFQHQESVEIFYSLIGDPGEPPPKMQPGNWFMPFLLTKLGDRFEDFLRRWYATVNRLEYVANMYTSTLHEMPRFPEIRVLVYAQVLEGFHRLAYDRRTWPENEWSVVQAKLLAGLSEKDAKELKGKLKQLNFVSLKSRLSDIYKQSPKTAALILKAGQLDKGAFFDAVEGTRNTYAHALVPPHQHARTGLGLWQLTTQLKVLCEVVFLREIGFTDDETAEMITQCRRLQDIRLYGDPGSGDLPTEE